MFDTANLFTVASTAAARKEGKRINGIYTDLPLIAGLLEKSCEFGKNSMSKRKIFETRSGLHDFQSCFVLLLRV